ncbi:hypothetical protein FQN50_002617 [Emmonsiellopsis sp. PD_5]|nr:hypothetical protein FQN50_002617 [Emmonsiellopsis sp. PD_5]
MRSLTLTPLLLTLTTAATIRPPPIFPTLQKRAGPPNIPSASEASSLLDGITVAPTGPQDGYDRDLFPHWITIDGNCNTRETVLNRDGTDTDIGSDCYPESGTWVSPYDGGEWTKASDVDIDHMVPLSNAWKSGAAEWSTEQRQAFANDLENPQLWAVTDNVNQEKSDMGPEEWKPPLESFYCTYACAYIKVKSVYELTINEDEKAALSDMLGTC